MENLIDKCEVCNYVGFNSQQQKLGRQTMSRKKCKMGIVSLNSHLIMRKVISDCARKIDLIGSYPCDYGQDRRGRCGGVARRR